MNLKPKLHAALSQALAKATMTPEVDVRVTFDDMADCLLAVQILIDVLDSIGAYDAEKTRQVSGEVSSTRTAIELKNGSCISLHFADKVWLNDHWVQLLTDAQKHGTP